MKNQFYIAWHEYGSNAHGLWRNGGAWRCAHRDEGWDEIEKLKANGAFVLVMQDCVGAAYEEVGGQLLEQLLEAGVLK